MVELCILVIGLKCTLKKIVIKVEFTENKAGWTGGAILFYNFKVLTRVTASFQGKSVVTFTKNIGRTAGAMFGSKSDILVTDQSMVMFTENNATTLGGAIYAEGESTIVLDYFKQSQNIWWSHILCK